MLVATDRTFAGGRLPIHAVVRGRLLHHRVARLAILGMALMSMMGAHSQSPMPARESTRLDIVIVAADDLNPNDKGRPAPVVVRLYELRSAALFEAADYFSLQTNDRSMLGTDLLAREEFILKPGETRIVRRNAHPDIAALAVLVGYRDLATSEWRAVLGVEPAPEAAWYRALWPAQRSRIRIQLQSQAVRITPVE